MVQNQLPNLKNERQCTGCGACIAGCAKGAITKKTVGFGAWIPEVNPALCVHCGRCERACIAHTPAQAQKKTAYIAYNRDIEMRKRSASGGVFSALAMYVLAQGGTVYGAGLRFEHGKAVLEHTKVTRIDDLLQILGSKYVQSDCVEACRQAKDDLAAGKTVLFSGCSCQIAGLQAYLGATDQSKLYTIDLICHGVPGIGLFNDYVAYLEKKYDAEVIDLSFRAKESGQIVFKIVAKFGGNTKHGMNRGGFKQASEADGRVMEKQIPLRKSGFYRMFMGEESYRQACYQCPYASLDKPADITIGDYFEAQKDYPDLFSGKDAIDSSMGISCLVTHTDKGRQLLEQAQAYLYLKEVDVQRVQMSHGNLQRPSRHSHLREKLLSAYQKKGYASIERYYRLRNLIIVIPRMLVRMLRRNG